MKFRYSLSPHGYVSTGSPLIQRGSTPQLVVGDVSPLSWRTDDDCSASRPFFYNNSWSYLPMNFQVVGLVEP